MRITVRRLLLAGLLAIVVTIVAVALALQMRTLKPVNTVCENTQGTADGETMTVAIVGDSWASQGRLLPGFREGFREGSTRPLRVCSISYPGRTSAEIVNGLNDDFGGDVSSITGQPTDLLIVLVGVNDVVAHSGAGSYAEALFELAKIPATKFAFVEIPSVEESKWEAPNLMSLAKNRLFMMINDQGQDRVVPKYRQHAEQTGLQEISFERFVAEVGSPPLRSDGLHLTREGDSLFGRYLGQWAGEDFLLEPDD